MIGRIHIREHERGLRFRDGDFVGVLRPGRSWVIPLRHEVEVVDATRAKFEHPRLDVLVRHASLAAELVVVDRREQVADVAGQEILTQDKVTLRVNLVVAFRIADPVLATGTVSDAAQTLYRDAQLALRAAVGTRALDALLADKESVGGEVRNALAARAREYGVEVRSVGLRDVVLPGGMKTILNQVVAAQKEAEANLIRRREETAAARSQANTARLLAENPVLVRLRELEALEKILAGAKTTFVLGPQDLATQIRTLSAGDAAK